jgi:hypothetical protein
MVVKGKILLLGFLVILIALNCGFTSPIDASESSSRRYEGFRSLPGLTDSVTVYWDERGMPHVYAANEHDLYLVSGFISAQERLWQMDLVRRSATGEVIPEYREVNSICLRLKPISRVNFTKMLSPMKQSELPPNTLSHLSRLINYAQSRTFMTIAYHNINQADDFLADLRKAVKKIHRNCRYIRYHSLN